MSIETANGKVNTLHKMIAECIIAGRMTFREIAKRFKAGVAAALKAMGREDLATDSNASRKGED